MSIHLKVIGDIVQLIEKHGPMGTAEMAHRLGLHPIYLRKCIGYWIRKDLFDVDKTHVRCHIYSLKPGAVQALLIDKPERVHDPVIVQVKSKFKMPDHLTGPALSPMAWSLRHLLGAAG